MQNLNQRLIKKLGRPPGLIPIRRYKLFFDKVVDIIQASPELDEIGFNKTPNNPNILYEVILEAYICYCWFRGCIIGDKINTKKTSYGFKHQVEAWLKRYPSYPISYISNSAFILAYLFIGSKYQRTDPNIYTTIKNYPDLLLPHNFIQ